MQKNENTYENKKILFMGDSITALDTSERGWIRYFNEIIKPSHFVNVAVSGASWEDVVGTVYDGNPVFDPNDTQQLGNVMGNQVEKVLMQKSAGNSDYADFDIIIAAAGTNRGGAVSTDTVASVDRQFISSNGETIPLDKVDRKTWAGAIRYFYEKMRDAYPNAKIFICSPIQGAEGVRPYASIKAKGVLLSAICDRISDVTFVNTFNCGICGIYEQWQKNGRDLIDGLHPNKSGAEKIGLYNANSVKLHSM